MPLPRIAIVGRPNVGKSSLLNMLAKAQVSIVDPTPGVTRDRVSAVIEMTGPLQTETPKIAEIVDTGGWGVYTADGARYDEIGEDLSRLRPAIERQIGEAVAVSDLVLFVVDAQAGVTQLDDTVARLLRQKALQSRGSPKESGRSARDVPILVVANKVDSDKWIPDAMEGAGLGFGEPICVSAKNKRYKRSLMEALYEALPETAHEAAGAEGLKLAIVGKRNAGKSTFVNALAGEDRVIASEIAGTTRDSVDVRLDIDGRTVTVIDTAGFRRRKSLADAIEWRATQRALASVRRCDVAMLLIDATLPVSQVDKQLSGEVSTHFKPCVIVVNKWDLAKDRRNVKGRPISPDDYREYLEKELRGLRRSPIIFTSASEGAGLREAVDLAFELHEQSVQRVSTGKLNRTVREILAERGPSSKLGGRAKVMYVTQVAVNPPTIVMIVNKEELFPAEYRRYLLNRLAERTPFEEVPIRLILRERERVDLQQLFAGEHRKDIEHYREDEDPYERPGASRSDEGEAEDLPIEAGGGDRRADDPD